MNVWGKPTNIPVSYRSPNPFPLHAQQCPRLTLNHFGYSSLRRHHHCPPRWHHPLRRCCPPAHRHPRAKPCLCRPEPRHRCHQKPCGRPTTSLRRCPPCHAGLRPPCRHQPMMPPSPPAATWCHPEATAPWRHGPQCLSASGTWRLAFGRWCPFAPDLQPLPQRPASWSEHNEKERRREKVRKMGENLSYEIWIWIMPWMDGYKCDVVLNDNLN
jgi:hypothetical protein